MYYRWIARTISIQWIAREAFIGESQAQYLVLSVNRKKSDTCLLDRKNDYQIDIYRRIARTMSIYRWIAKSDIYR